MKYILFIFVISLSFSSEIKMKCSFNSGTIFQKFFRIDKNKYYCGVDNYELIQFMGDSILSHDNFINGYSHRNGICNGVDEICYNSDGERCYIGKYLKNIVFESQVSEVKNIDYQIVRNVNVLNQHQIYEVKCLIHN